MKSLLANTFLFWLVVGITIPSAQTKQIPARITTERMDGEDVALGEIQDRKLNLKKGQADLSLPLSRVKHLSFTAPEKVKRAIIAEDFSGKKPLIDFWSERAEYAFHIRTNLIPVGIEYARALFPEDPESALETLSRLSESPHLRKEEWFQVVGLQAELLARNNDLEEAEATVEKLGNALAGVTADDEKELIFTVQWRFARGETALAQVRHLEREWPKWQLMPEQIAKRNLLLHHAIQDFLYADAMVPQKREEAAEGLWKALQVFQLLGLEADAKVRARELEKYHTGSRYQVLAQRFLQN